MTIEYPLSTYKDVHKVNMVHFVLRSNGKGFTGEISLETKELWAAGPGAYKLKR